MERPNRYEIEEAIDTIERLKNYIAETEPKAKNTIATLQTAMDELTANIEE